MKYEITVIQLCIILLKYEITVIQWIIDHGFSALFEQWVVTIAKYNPKLERIKFCSHVVRMMWPDTSSMLARTCATRATQEILKMWT